MTTAARILLPLLVSAPCAPALAAGLDARCKAAFKPLRLPDFDKRLGSALPRGIVIESAPFDAIVARELRAFDGRWRERRAVLEAIGNERPASAARLVSSALEAVVKERALLAKRLAATEADYAEVFNRGYMASSEGARRTRRLAAVTIPIYRRLQLAGEQLAEAAARALAPLEPAGRLAALARTHKLAAVRATAARALALKGGDPARTAVVQVLRTDRDPLVRAAALGGLMRWTLAETKRDTIAALSDPAWNVRALAIRICVRGKLSEAAGALIEALKREDGRLRKDLDDALVALTGVRFYGDTELWSRWWKDNRERVEREAAARDDGHALGDPSGWKRADAVHAGDTEENRRKGHTSAFYGIPTVSKRIAFVIDISRSMQDAAGTRPPAPGDPRRTKYPEPAGSSKIDVARWQLHRAIEALPKDARFDLVVYSESCKVWQESMVEAKPGARRKAHRFVDAIVANGVTNIADSLDRVFDLAGVSLLADRKKPREPAVDTIYLLSDGDPNRGRLSDLEALLADITGRNPPGLFVIHTVGIGEAAGSSFLERLAQENGGRYVGSR